MGRVSSRPQANPTTVQRFARANALRWHAPQRLCLSWEAAEPQNGDAQAEPGHQM